MSQLMFRIRNEFYKITTTDIIEVLSNFYQESVEEVFFKLEKKKLSFDEIKLYIVNLPVLFAKRVLSIVKDFDIRDLVESYMLSYEIYNLNTLLRARLSGYIGKDLFVFDYSTVSNKDDIVALENVEQVKKLYLETLSYHRIGDKVLKDIVKTISRENMNELLVYSSLVYYRHLFGKKIKFGYSLKKLLKVKAFYEILLMFAKVSFLSGVDIGKYVGSCSFLGSDGEILMDILLTGRDGFIKKCIDYEVIPPNFVVTDIDDIDRFKNISLKQKCKNLIIGDPMDPSTIIAMIILREIDMKNYFSVIGGIVGGFELEKVRQFLVL